MSGYDAIVVGAGHNGLTAAALLARQGRRVLVLERAAWPGGLAAGEEFHPGYRSAGLLHDTEGVRPAIVRALSLERWGLELRAHPTPVVAFDDAGASLLVEGPDDACARELERLAPADVARRAELRGWLASVRKPLGRWLDAPPADLVTLGTGDAWRLLRRSLDFRRLGRARLLELLRAAPMCVADWLDEWFSSNLLKAALALPAVAGSFAGPRSPGTTANLLLREAARGNGIRGDATALVRALVSAAAAAGVELRTSAAVEQIRVAGGAVTGVTLAGGETIDGRTVLASCDPKQLFLRLLPPGRIGGRLHRHFKLLRARGTTAQLLLALSGPLTYACRPGERIALARTGSDLEALERAFDPIKYGRIAERPALEIHVPTVASPELAPPGCDTLSVLVHFVPPTPAPEAQEAMRRSLLEHVSATLEPLAPGLMSLVAHAEVLLPPDIEARYGCSGGQLHHTEPALDQLLLRPAPGCTGYRTPIEGLHLCGSGSHPGGGLTCAPGALAAGLLLGRSIL